MADYLCLVKRGDERLYRCDGCGHVGPWDSAWSWFGKLGEPAERVACGRCRRE